MKIAMSILIGTFLRFLILIGFKGAYARQCLSNPQELEMEHVDGDFFAYLASLDFTTTTVQLGDELSTQITTRVHQSTNNPIPGVVTSPTIRVKRGTKLEIKLRNLLEPTPDCGDVECVENTLQKPNLTNMHTHGLHVSGAVKGDDIMHVIDGGDDHTYNWNLPCDHPGGTAWYHPHTHGNSVIQVGGGAAGALIVEDDPVQDGFPSWITDPVIVDPEAVLVLQHLENKYITTMGQESTPQDNIFSYQGSDSIWLVNSVYKPEICMTEGKWRRWRMVHVDTRAGHNLIIEPQEGTVGTCVIQLLAKDAVTVSPAPRPVSGIYFTVSGRVDVMVHCPAGKYNLIGLDQGVLATIVSTSVEGTPSTPSSLTVFEPIRPPFLKDTFDEIITSGVTPLVDASEDAIMGVSWNPSNPPLVIMSINGVHEWDVIDVGYHPFHLHVHHVQLMADTDVSGVKGWGKAGDWVDVVDQDSKVRFRTDRFGGPAIMHCHVLEHEDKGSMGLAYVVGGCDALYNDLDDGGAECDVSCPNLIPTEPPQCYNDDQCEGTDKCDDNTCVPQCSSDVECVSGQLCNVEAGKCVECMVEENCEGNFLCINNTCEAECMKSNDCLQENYLCYEHQCIPECTSSSDCAFDQFCTSNKCVECQTDDHCKGTRVCSGETYQCQPQCTKESHCDGNLFCENEICAAECTNDNDCNGSLVCSFDLCSSQCAKDKDCDDDEYCIEGVCGECEKDEHCSGKNICTDFHACEPECTKDSDCTGSKVCDDVDQVCIFDCQRDEECPGSLICSSNNICQKECDEDTDCATGHRCSSSKKCAEICSVDLDCPLSLLCSSENTCVACMNTSQCSMGFHCDASYTCTSSNCESDSDCLFSDTCVTNICVNQKEAKEAQPLTERWQFWASVSFIGTGSIVLSTAFIVWLKQ